VLSGASQPEPEPEAREHEKMHAKRWVEKASAEQQEAGGQWARKAARLLSWLPNERHGGHVYLGDVGLHALVTLYPVQNLTLALALDFQKKLLDE
jgi:hypothetical protein